MSLLLPAVGELWENPGATLVEAVAEDEVGGTPVCASARPFWAATLLATLFTKRRTAMSCNVLGDRASKGYRVNSMERIALKDSERISTTCIVPKQANKQATTVFAGGVRHKVIRI